MSLNKTLIDWVKNPDGTPGYTWNPITGCLERCEYCYAWKLANTRLRERYLANENILGGYTLARGVLKEGAIPPKLDPFYPRFWEDRLYEPVNKMRRWGRQRRVLHTQEPKGIFVCDMSDLFGIGIPEEWTKRVLDRFQYAPQHRFYLLTKQSQNLIKFSPFPDNCWVGVSATDAQMTLKALRYFEEIKANMKYISFEPLLNYIGGEWLREWLQSGVGIKWVIIGSQTKPYKPPDKLWVAEIVEACKKAGVPYFLKDNLRPLLGNNLVQDMPKGVEIDH